MTKSFCLFKTVTVISIFLICSCASTPKKEPSQPADANDNINVSESESQSIESADANTNAQSSFSDAVRLSLPPKRNTTYLSSVNENALSAVENGSPESLRLAATLLRKDAESYSEPEKVLLNVVKSLAQIVWPSQTFTIEAPAFTEANPYTGAIESARHGVYDTSTGNVDFLTMVLPSLVLLTSDSRNDYYNQSRDDLESALKTNSDSVLGNYLLGTLYKRQKLYAEAIPYFSSAYSKAADCPEVAYALAECHFYSGNTKEADSLAKEILQHSMQYRPALKLCAETSFALGNLSESEQYVARVLQQEPENAYYVLFRAKILIRNGDYIRAASLLDVYARTNDTDKEYLLLRLKIQKDWNRNLTAAAATVEKAFSLYPDDLEILSAAAELSSDTGAKINGMDAGQIAELILTADSENFNALKIQIEDSIRKSDWNTAYSTSAKLLSLQNIPSETRESAVFTHITICLSSGKTEEAWQLASNLYEQNPQDETVLQSYLKVLIATNRKAEASALIAQLLPTATSRMRSSLYYERSFLAATEEDTLADLRSSLTAYPRNADALFRLYTIYFNKREYRKAQYYLKQVVSLTPNDEKLLQLNKELESLLSR